MNEGRPGGRSLSNYWFPIFGSTTEWLDSGRRHIVLDAAVIDRIAIERAIHKFGEMGKVQCQSAAPIPRSRLPDQTESEAMAAYRASRFVRSEDDSNGWLRRGGVCDPP